MKTLLDFQTGQIITDTGEAAPALSLADLKTLRLAWNDAHRAGLLAQPQTFSWDGATHTLSADPDDLRKLISDVATASLGQSIAFPTTAGIVEIPLAEALPIAVAIKAAIRRVETSYYNYKTAVANAATIEQLPAEAWS